MGRAMAAKRKLSQVPNGWARVSRESRKSLTDDQIKQTFPMIDKDNDGEITVKESGAVLRKLKQNPTDNEVESMARELDHDGNGVITLDEFKYAISKRSKY